jgi:hypothetical protein
MRTVSSVYSKVRALVCTEHTNRILPVLSRGNFIAPLPIALFWLTQEMKSKQAAIHYPSSHYS